MTIVDALVILLATPGAVVAVLALRDRRKK